MPNYVCNMYENAGLNLIPVLGHMYCLNKLSYKLTHAFFLKNKIERKV